MKLKLLIGTVITATGLMLQPLILHAEEGNSGDDTTYEENAQGYEDSMGYYDDTPMDTEASGSETDVEPSDQYDDSEAPSDN